FFFQAEDGIRDFHVTGVQTCALPICEGAGPVLPAPPSEALPRRTLSARSAGTSPGGEGRVSPRRIVSRATLPAPRYAPCSALRRSEERRVGKPRRSKQCTVQTKT